MTETTPYEVLARKYRPKQFADVVGQQHVTRTLSNALTSGRIAHAYLLVGPRGIGKTSIARIFAKALNCRTGPTATPCDVCESCLEIAGGRSLDVMEIDGASNNGVDQVRELRDNVRYAPARGPFKVYVIDEVHMLSIAAFNALLKTLEEPPAHVKFIFATTEPQKVPATITSRCQRFDLRRITANDLIGQLRRIASAEKVEIEEDALLAIARGAEGGMRDAESAFDQLISFCGRTITEPDVLSVFGLVSRRELESLALAILNGQASGILDALGELDRGGKDLQRVVLELMEHFRNVLVVQQGGEAYKMLGLPDRQVETLRDHAARTDPSQLLRIVELLIEMEGRLRFSLSRRTLLETALIRCARTASSVSIETVLRQMAEWRAQTEQSDPNPLPPPPPARAATPVPERPVARPSAPAPVPAAAAAGSGSLSDKDWEDVMVEVRSLLPKVAALLHNSSIQDVDATQVTVGVVKDAFPDPANGMEARGLRAIEKALARRLGRTVGVRFIHAAPKPGPAPRPAAPRPVETPHDAKPESAVPSKPTAPSRPSLHDDPRASQIVNLFEGSIVPNPRT